MRPVLLLLFTLLLTSCSEPKEAPPDPIPTLTVNPAKNKYEAVTGLYTVVEALHASLGAMSEYEDEEDLYLRNEFPDPFPTVHVAEEDRILTCWTSPSLKYWMTVEEKGSIRKVQVGQGSCNRPAHPVFRLWDGREIGRPLAWYGPDWAKELVPEDSKRVFTPRAR